MQSKEIQFVITIKPSEDGNGIQAENKFTVDGKEATFADVSFNEKYVVLEALKGSLGCLANILLIETEQKPKERGVINSSPIR